MNQRRHVSMVAAGATLLAALPLSTVFDRWTWLVDSVLAVGVTLGVALAVRSFRVPSWVPTAAMSGALVLLLGWFFGGHEVFGVIPGPGTLDDFNTLLLSAGRDMRSLGIPVEDTDGLLFLVTLGIGAVAIVVDFFAVVLRRPALAGLPMLALYSVPVAVHDDSVSLIPFALGSAGFLWLLVTDNVDRVRRFGRRFTGDGRDVDLWEPSPLAAAGRRLAVMGVLLAVIVPLAVPGMTSGLLDRYGTGVGGDGKGPGGTRSASVNLFAVLAGNLSQTKPFDMIRVQTNDPNPFYTRFGVADELTPAGFRNRPPSGGQPVNNNLAGPQIAAVSGVVQHNYRATVDILNFEMTLLPVYLAPTKIEKLDSAWFYDRTGQVVYSSRATSKNKKYAVDFVRTDFSPDALRNAAQLPPNDPVQRQYTSTPPNTKVANTVKDLITGKQAPYDKVRAILDFFSLKNRFTYSLTTKIGTSGSDMVDFLENRQGFCEQYAAAMAWMVRAANIPARVAFGFTRGTKRTGNTYTLTNLNLHAWTEVYFDKFGWVPFDPTPASAVPGSVHAAWAPDPDRPSTSGNSEPSDDLTPGGSFGPSGSAPAGGPHVDPFENGGAAGPLVPTAPRWPMWTLIGLVVALLALTTPGLTRAMLRRRRWPDRIAAPPAATMAPTPRHSEPRVLVTDEAVLAAARRRAHGAWDELIDTMIDYRIDLDESETPRATAERLVAASRLIEPVAGGVRLLGSAEERARYARRPLETDALASSLAAVRGAIANRVSRRTRLIATLLPPSVLNRWRNTAVLRSTSAMNAIAARRDTLVRVLSPRRLLPGRFGRS